MTELEKIAYAKSFIDKLANGINPLDDTPVPEGDIVNNVRLSRCFFFVSGILGQVCENGGVVKHKRPRKEPFSITCERLEKFEYSKEPIGVMEISKRLWVAAEAPNMKKLPCRKIMCWLSDIGAICFKTIDGRAPVKLPTEIGMQLGILVETRVGRRGENYQAILFNEDAQRFIVDNICAIMATDTKKHTDQYIEEYADEHDDSDD